MKKILFILFLVVRLSGQFAGGSGTVESPYLISNVSQFDSVRYFSNSHFKLTKNIIFTDSFTPIAEFSGVLNGDGYKLVNPNVLQYSEGEFSWNGIFKRLDSAVVKNLLIDGFTNTVSSPSQRVIYSGVLAAEQYYSLVENVAVINSTLDISNVRVKKFSGDSDFYAYQGGLVGYSKGGGIKSSNVLINLAQNYSTASSGYGTPTPYIYFGGLVGYADSTIIKACGSNSTFGFQGNLTVQNDIGLNYIGGLVGYVNGGAVSDSYAITSTGTHTMKGTINRYKVYYSGFVAGGNAPVGYSYSILNPGGVNQYDVFVEYGYFNSSEFTGDVIKCIANSDYFGQKTTKGKYNSSVNLGTISQLKSLSFYQSHDFDFIKRWTINQNYNNGFAYIYNHYVGYLPQPPQAPKLYEPADSSRGVGTDTTFAPIVKFRWEEISNANQYNISVIKVVGSQNVIVYENNTNLTQISLELEFGTEYKWRVGAVNSAGTNYSSFYTFYTVEDQAVLTVGLLKPAADTTGLELPYIFYWKDLNEADDYDFEIWNVQKNERVINYNNTLDTTYQLNDGLTSGTNYVWRVKANYSGNSTSWSVRNFTTNIAMPDTVIFVYPSKGAENITVDADSSIKWRWDSNYDDVFIQVINTDLSDTIYSSSFIYPDTSIGITIGNNFETYTNYKLRAKGVNSEGESDYNQWIEFSTGNRSLDDHEPPNPDLPTVGTVPNWWESEEGGLGTAEFPYLISTPEQLDSVRWYRGSLEDSVYFKVVKNIDMSGYHLAMMDTELSELIYIVFDGNGYAIKNLLKETTATGGYNSFFWKYPAAFRMFDLIFDNCTLSFTGSGSNHGYFGIVSGRLGSVNISKIIFMNSNVIIRGSYNSCSAGILAGNGGVINLNRIAAINCSIDVQVSAVSGVRLGGIIHNIDGNINESFYIGNIRGERVGTFVNVENSGFIAGSAKINDCFAIGDFINTKAADGASVNTFVGLVATLKNNVRGYYSVDYRSSTEIFNHKIYIDGQSANNRNLYQYYADLSKIDSSEDTASVNDGTLAGKANRILTIEEMKTQGTFDEFDFGNVWAIDTTGVINDGYPYLQWRIPNDELQEDEEHLISEFPLKRGLIKPKKPPIWDKKFDDLE